MNGVRARVQIVVEVEIKQGWGDDCSVGQARLQAEREAQDRVRRLVEADGVGVRLVGVKSLDLVASFEDET